jgi:hypothetical protein
MHNYFADCFNIKILYNMVAFTVNGLNTSLLNTVAFTTIPSPEYVISTTIPRLDLSMPVSLWNQIFAFRGDGDNTSLISVDSSETVTYTTYSANLPTLDTISFTTSGSGASGLIATVVITSGNVTAITTSAAGSGYAAADTITIYINGVALGAYTLHADDVSSGGLVATLDGSSMPTNPSTIANGTYTRTTMATTNLAANITIESGDTDQSIPAYTIRKWALDIFGVENKSGSFSNVDIVTTALQGLLTGTASTDLHDKIQAQLTTANNNNESATTVANVSRQLYLQLLDSVSSSRLASGSGNIYVDANIVSNLFGTLPVNSNSIANGTYTSSLSLANTSVASTPSTNAVASSVTIAGDVVTAVKLSTAGAGYTAGDTITISINSVALGAYTVVANDLDSSDGFGNKIYNFLFETNDTLSFQVTMQPESTDLSITDNEPSNQAYTLKVTMV